jgi:hypothetical protein
MGDSLLNAILDWMQNNRIRLASYERIVSSVPGADTFDHVAAVVGNYPGIFRTAVIKGGMPGLALVDGYSFPHVVSAPALNVGDLSTAQTTNDTVSPTVPVPETPQGYTDMGSVEPAATSASRVLSPKECVIELINRAANSDVSGTAVNYANAAMAAATALNLLDQAE